MTRAQWRLMLRLSVSPLLRQVEVAELLDIEPITLCRIVDRLEEAGLVERQRDPSDRRAWLLKLTTTAEPLLEKLRTIATELSAEAFDGLEMAHIDAVRSGLARIRDNLSQLTETHCRVSA
ncbi:MarR family transcriptional regulator [Sphingomonas sp.]|uniref:MarR family winged helix-turn-helix transcriptional regulator n=1 Tax=Sphingomonas sp. TaxID=28214 RepID=UPI00286BB2F0|nr:MarR family transcriptional regulator [Sphingomonas sp.]